jgi:hypothetical protein
MTRLGTLRHLMGYDTTSQDHTKAAVVSFHPYALLILQSASPRGVEAGTGEKRDIDA